MKIFGPVSLRRNFVKNICIQSLICYSLALVSLIAVGLSGYMGLQAYKRNVVASRLSAMNDLADQLISASAKEAIERGFSATLLANPSHIPPGAIAKIRSLREDGDKALQRAIAIGDERANNESSDSQFTQALDELKRTYKDVGKAREMVDMSLREGKQYIPPIEWFNTMTNLIKKGAQLRQKAFTYTDDPLQQIVQENLMLKQAIWLVSEYMGRERGTIGPIIAARKKISPARLERLRTYRSFVDLGLDQIRTFRNEPHIDPQIASAIDAMDRDLGEFDVLREKVYRAASTGRYPVSATEWFSRATQAINKVLHVSSVVTDVNKARADMVSSKGQQALFMSILMVGGILVFVAFIFILLREKMKRIKDLSDSMVKLAEGRGDLSFRLDVSSTDEIGRAAKAFNTFMEQLENIILHVGKVTEQVASSAMELSSMSEEMSKSSENQTQQTLQAASAIEEMSSSINEVAKNTTNVANFSNQAKELAEEGGKIVDSVVATMESISESVMKAATAINTLGESSKQIGEIVLVIDNIAEQTNLLALNAAIEAARASEQGKGFAVVADEVRKLAERTTKATSNIDEIIKNIQKDIDNVIKVMHSGTQEVEKGVEMAKKAGESLTQIVDASRRVTDMVMQIATAAEEQSAVSVEVAENVDQISHLCKSNNEAASATARSSEELSRLTLELREIMGRFNVEEGVC